MIESDRFPYELIDRLVSDPRVRYLVARLAACAAEAVGSQDVGAIDQAASPLGRRRHCACVRRRVARGEPGAAVVGRRFFLSPAAMTEELQRTTRRSGQAIPASERSVRRELLAELALVQDGGERD